MTRRLILHIGPHKTGTTALQQWLLSNAESLRDAGLAFPRKLSNRTGKTGDLARACMAVEHGEKDISKEDIRAQFQDFCRRNSSCDVLFCSEGFSLLLPIEGGAGFRPHRSLSQAEPWPSVRLAGWSAEASERAAKHLIAFSQSLGFDAVHIVLNLREISSSLASRHLQALKRLRLISGLITSPVDSLPILDYAPRLTEFEQAGLKVSVLPYKSAEHPDKPLPHRLLDQVGWIDKLEGKVDLTPPRANPSPGAVQSIALGHLHTVLRASGQETHGRRRQKLSLMLVRLCKDIPFGEDSRFVAFDEATARRLQIRQKPKLDALAPWLSGTEIEHASGLNDPVPPRSPMTWAELSDQQKETAQEWLNAVADAVKEHDNLGTILKAEAIRNIENTDPGPHSYGSQPEALAV